METRLGRPMVVMLVDLEPALAASLLILLKPHRDFEVSSSRGEEAIRPAQEPDVLLVTPYRPERLTELRRRFPQAYILARVSWDRKGFQAHPAMDERLDMLASFQTVLETLHRIRRDRLKPAEGDE